MQYVYLDMNVIVDCLQGRDPDLQRTLDDYNKNETIFPYSPAHMEEVAVILKSEKDEKQAISYVFQHLSYISKLSDNWEYLPSQDRGIVLLQEEPKECFGRVIELYGWTEFAEENEQFIQCFRDKKSCAKYLESLGQTGEIDGMPLFEKLQEHHNINKQELNNISPEYLFDDQTVVRAFDSILGMHGYSFDSLSKYKDISKNHPEIESVVNLLYNFLEKIGYRTEKRGKSRSRMHDVTHGIYATSADIFVIGDERYRMKTQAIFSLLEVPTKVLSKEEFMQTT